MFALSDCPEIGIEIRKRWAHEVIKLFDGPYNSIRSWDLLAKLDGSVCKLDESDSSLEIPVSMDKAYPARFQIPASCLRELDHSQRVRKIEMFAMASLLYEIMSGAQLFEELTDEEVQDRFGNGDFPSDASSLPNSLFIYSGWSEEFLNELTRQVTTQDVSRWQSISNYAKAHPLLTGIQVVGVTLSAVSFFAVPVLGAVGFTAAGPAAGSAAAAWQASIGAVQAGGLFAWCQSAAMGGAAMGGVQAAGLAGAALTRVADVPGLVETFKRVFRTSNNVE
ncbi:hypothetical protein MMC13_007610 [Lambiella insularis]|nr:hypothetical protein [Lambiella insularis]